MTIRSFLIVAAALATPLAAAASTEPFGAVPPVVRPGPPQILSDPHRWLPWREFTWRDGVKPGAPGLAEDAQGYIWAGTPEGLVRYNGQVWQRFDPPAELSPVPSFSMLAARDGTLWLGTLDGRLLRLRAEVWSRVNRPPGIPPGLVEVLAETVEEGRSTVWVGTSTGLARCRGEACSEITALHGTTVRSLAATRSADAGLGFWIGTNRGLRRLDGADGPRPLLSPLFNDPAVLPDLSIRSLAETVGLDGEKSLWVATDRGVARLKAGVWARYDAGSGFAPGPVVKLLASRSATGEPVVWAGSFRSGLIRFQDDGQWQLFDSRCGLPANYVYNLLATGTSRDPTLWLATPAALVRLDRERWHAVDTRSGLPNDLVVGVGEATFPDGLHTYWIGTISGMVRFTQQGWERFLPESPQVVFEAMNAREADGTESLWLSTLEGLQRFSHGQWTSFNTRNSPLPHNWIMSLLAVAGRQGPEIWAGTSNGLAHLANGRWTVYRGGVPGGGLPGHEVWAIAAAPTAGGEPVIWAGTEAGLARFDGRAWEAVPMPCQPRPRILSVQIITDPQGLRWLWTGARGSVARMRLDDRSVLQGPCERLSDRTHPALSHPTVNQVQTDVQGRVYVFTDWGVDRLTLPPGGGLSAARLEVFEAGDGLPGIQFNRAGFRDHLGRIWGGAVGGAAILDPTPPRDAAPGPGGPLLLERVLVAGHERPLASHTVLRHDENSLEFQFTLLSFRREHATVYRTQLAGLEDSRPTPWSREARAVYNRLPRGDYIFRVWGRDGEGTVSGPLELSFQVRPAPWLTSWAIAFYALALVGLGGGYSHLRVKALARRAALLEHQVAERTRELAEANSKLELASLTDPLTGLSNRRFLDLNIGPDLGQAVRNAQSLLDRNADLIFYFIDLDHFKRLNDKTGHAAGDAVLVEIGRRLREVARTTDAVVRWGGEEFLIVSRWTNRQAGAVLASRTLEVVAGEPFVVDGERLTITCSVGWAPYPWSTANPEALPFEEVLSLADRALYLAKREGRNRAVGVLPGTERAGAGPWPESSLETLEGRYVELIRQEGPDVVPSFSPASVDSGQIRTVTRA
jgi:diguanylate cyclase (GGDEF)-like protein